MGGSVTVIPLPPLASSMTTTPLFVWARTPPLNPARPRLRLTAAMMSHFMDDLPVRGLADGRTPRPVAAHALTGHECRLCQRVARGPRFPRSPDGEVATLADVGNALLAGAAL